MASTSNKSHGLQETRAEDKTIMLDERDSLAEAISIFENQLEDLNIKRRLGNNLLGDLDQLSLEFNGLTRKFTELKETEKLAGKKNQKRINISQNQYSQTDNSIIQVSDAKSIITNCMLQLLSINHFLDGNESKSMVIKKLLTHQCFDNSDDNYNIQSLSVGPVYFEVKSQGIYDEQEMQTDSSSKNNLKEQNRRKPKKSCFNWFCCSDGDRKKQKKRKKNKRTGNKS